VRVLLAILHHHVEPAGQVVLLVRCQAQLRAPPQERRALTNASPAAGWVKSRGVVFGSGSVILVLGQA
jgi:hypothetical protein